MKCLYVDFGVRAWHGTVGWVHVHVHCTLCYASVTHHHYHHAIYHSGVGRCFDKGGLYKKGAGHVETEHEARGGDLFLSFSGGG